MTPKSHPSHLTSCSVDRFVDVYAEHLLQGRNWHLIASQPPRFKGTMEKFKKTTALDRQIRVQTLSTGGGRILCQRCLGVSRRTGVQCAAPAERGRNWCRFHGGKSRGPTSPEGRARCAAAKTVHGQETTAARAERSRDIAAIRALEALGYVTGLLTGPRMRGRKPRHG